MPKQKIAVLGGGCGGMSAVWALTSEAGWQDKYDITVYQLGWRLGGKGASGRGPDGRIQEHGLHIWMGFYENAFRVMRQAFQELEGEPRVFQSIEDAFEAQSKIGVMENINGDWRPWVIPFPHLPGEPGDGQPKHHDSVFDLVATALKDLIGILRDLLDGDFTQTEQDMVTGFATKPSRSLLAGLRNWLEDQLEEFGETALHATERMLSALPAQWHADGTVSGHIIDLLEHTIDEIEEFADHADQSEGKLSNDHADTLRRIGIVIDLGKATMKGLLSNYSAINEQGLDVFDDLDLQEFFKKYGAKPQNYQAATSAPVRGFYDLVFGYENGETDKPNFAASAALRSIFSILLLYKNSVFMKMRAGMGDTIFAPLHKGLEKRGVKFEFFHRVTDMGLEQLASGEHAVGSISFDVQATPKTGHYAPYVNVMGLDCWPQAPLTDQLVEGEAIKAGPKGDGTDDWSGNWAGYDLEDFWTSWQPAGAKTLIRGQDFDQVILAIPPASHPFICPDLVAASPQWQNMIDRVGSVRTQAMQLWMKSPISGLGWDHGSAVVDAFQQPMNTWADMTHLINRESWPISAPLGSIAYFCGPMTGDIPPPSERHVTEDATKTVMNTANGWLQSAPGAVWPDAVTEEGALQAGELVQGRFSGGEELLKGQYWRANVSPSERYVLSLKGTGKDRLDADGAGFSNLFFAGDWTNNKFNAGCVEASVMSGLFASNALAGYPKLADIETYW